MRKIILFNSYDYGSTGTLCSSLKEAITLNGDVCCFVVGNEPKSAIGDVYLKEVSSKLSRYLAIKEKKLFGQTNSYLQRILTKRLLTRVDHAVGIDPKDTIFHLHNLQCCNIDSLFLLGYAAKKGIKCIVTLHDNWYIAGGCNYFLYSGCDGWKNGCQNHFETCRFNWHRSEAKRKKRTYRRFNYGQITFVSPSTWLDSVVSNSFASEHKHIVIHNGIDTSFWTYSDDDKKTNGAIRLLAVASNWNESKGAKYLYELADILPSNYQLTMVGHLDKKWLKPNVTFIDSANKEQLKKLYSSSHIFINPTLEDNFPTVDIEALLCGTIVVQFQDTGGSCEITDPKTSVIVSEKSSLALLEGVQKASKLLNSDLYKNCRERGLTFSLSNYIDSYLELYFNQRK